MGGLTVFVNIRLRRIHPKAELVKFGKVACRGHGCHVRAGVIDDQRVFLGQQRVSSCSIFACIPYRLSRRLICGVVRYGIGRTVGSAGDVDVNMGRLHTKGCVVPAKGNHIPDFVVCRCSGDGRCKHFDSARW